MGLALHVGRHTRRRNSAVRQLLWSDLDFETQTIRWRAETDKAGRANVTLMPDEVVEALRTALSRGIGDSPVFPSATDPSRPTSRDTFQIWLRRAKDRLLQSIEDPDERERLWVELRGVGITPRSVLASGTQRFGPCRRRFRKSGPGRTSTRSAGSTTT